MKKEIMQEQAKLKANLKALLAKENNPSPNEFRKLAKDVEIFMDAADLDADMILAIHGKDNKASRRAKEENNKHILKMLCVFTFGFPLISLAMIILVHICFLYTFGAL